MQKYQLSHPFMGSRQKILTVLGFLNLRFYESVCVFMKSFFQFSQQLRRLDPRIYLVVSRSNLLESSQSER